MESKGVVSVQIKKKKPRSIIHLGQLNCLKTSHIACITARSCTLLKTNRYET